MGPDERPQIVLTSPHRRPQATADLIGKSGGLAADAPPAVVDERLREREFGILDRLTAAGIREFHPEQAEFRRIVGKFYHRPPGGESDGATVVLDAAAMTGVDLAGEAVRQLAERLILTPHAGEMARLTGLEEAAVEQDPLTAARAVARDAQAIIIMKGAESYIVSP